MATLKVNDSQVSVYDESAITQQVNRRRDDAVCVQVRIDEGNLNMALATPQCTPQHIHYPDKRRKAVSSVSIDARMPHQCKPTLR
jgi:hypothetical protein